MQCLGIYKSKRENIYKQKRDTAQLARSWIVEQEECNICSNGHWSCLSFIITNLQSLSFFFHTTSQLLSLHPLHYQLSLSLSLGQGATLLLTSMHPLLPNMKLVLGCKAAIDLISDHPTLFLFYLQMHTFHVQKDGTVFGYLSRDLYSVICVVFYVNARQRNQTIKPCMGSWELTVLRFELTDKRCLVLLSLPIVRT